MNLRVGRRYVTRAGEVALIHSIKYGIASGTISAPFAEVVTADWTLDGTHYSNDLTGAPSPLDLVAEEPSPFVTPTRCECGSEACGSKKHSHWCPMHQLE
jgi:hypothetical protein